MTQAEVCNNERRRSDVRESDLKGLDYVEVSDDQLILTVYFLGKAPEQLEPGQIRIEGGRRITGIKVTAVSITREDDPELDDWMTVTVNKYGDFSTYTLRLVQPGSPRFPGFDPRYDSVDFTFKAGCPTDLDCKSDTSCPPPVYEQPEISYLAKDYASFRQLLLDRLAVTLPAWQERHVPDIGITMVELLAYTGDYLSYYQDAVATEAYLGTARQRVSVRRHARLVDYHISEGCNARTWLFVHTSQNTSSVSLSMTARDIYFTTRINADRSMLSAADVRKAPAGSYEVFEPLVADQASGLQFYKAHNAIWFYTWGDQECCLPRGATSATLQDYAHGDDPDEAEKAYLAEEVAEDEAAEGDEDESGQSTEQEQQAETPPTEDNPRILDDIKVGDFLLFEEVRGAKTGLKEDANTTRRHVVRLTSVERIVDELYSKNVLAIEWAAEDALPFPFCISNMGQAPECKLLQNISIARGNILLIDSGRTVVPDEDLDCVQEGQTLVGCEDEGQPADVQVLALPFSPPLQQAPLTYTQSLPGGLPPATGLLTQNPQQAMPFITLSSTLPAPTGTTGSSAPPPPVYTWRPQYDLLESGAEDRHFVVEIDDDGNAHLRFGDNESGRAPAPHECFKAHYRVGNGPDGNVGPETITQIVFRAGAPTGIELVPRNPFAAVGGTLPQPLTEIKLLAPQAFRSDIERAVTADDYAALAQRLPSVQRAAASLRWTGSNYEVLVAIDPLGAEVLPESQRRSIQHYLEQYRRVGHDVHVEQAQYVPLALALTVCVQPHYLRAHVKADLLRRFGNQVLPDGTLGFFAPDNLTFGGSIAVSALVAAAQGAPGVMSVTVDKLERFGEGPNQELRMGVLTLGPMEIAQLDTDPNFPEHGTLTIAMKGGR